MYVNNRMKIVIAIMLFVLFSHFSVAQNANQLHTFLSDSLDVIKERAQQQICGARYMEGKLLLETDTLPGWKGIPVALYEYSVFDKVYQKKLTTQVYMANANSERLARWIISTCYTITGALEKEDTDMLIKSIRSASGGQFPVQGVVYEDMYGTGQKGYNFKDGVTVYLQKDFDGDISVINIDNIARTGKYARIISTTREQYKAYGGTKDTTALHWLTAVREEYKKALQSDTNLLILSWAKQNLVPAKN